MLLCVPAGHAESWSVPIAENNTWHISSKTMRGYVIKTYSFHSTFKITIHCVPSAVLIPFAIENYISLCAHRFHSFKKPNMSSTKFHRNSIQIVLTGAKSFLGWYSLLIGSPLLIWINNHPSMDKQLQQPKTVGKMFFHLKLQQCSRWNLGKDKHFHTYICFATCPC